MERGRLQTTGLGRLAMLLGLAGIGGALGIVWWSGSGAAEAAAGAPATNGWKVLEPVTYENLSVFPVVGGPGADTSGFITLDEAMASGEAVVTEQGGEMIRRTRDGRPVPLIYPQGGGATVNRLVLINRSKRPLVLLAGEVVSGGKQDRVIAKDRIVAPEAEPLPLDVFCVEQGRWSAGSQFAAAKLMVHPSVREKAAVDQKQDEVWSAVRSGTTARNADPSAAPPRIAAYTLNETMMESGSAAYARIYDKSHVGQSVAAFAEEVDRRFRRATKGQTVVGVVVAYGGEVAWSDLFASGQLFERYWSKLVRSYSVEALTRAGSKEQASLADAREFLQPLKGRENVESEPGIYRWRQVTEGRYAEIELEALVPKSMKLHWMKVHRTS